MKRVFCLKNGDWVYSDGKLNLIEKSESDEKIILREPNESERREILLRLGGKK